MITECGHWTKLDKLIDRGGTRGGRQHECRLAAPQLHETNISAARSAPLKPKGNSREPGARAGLLPFAEGYPLRSERRKGGAEDSPCATMERLASFSSSPPPPFKAGVSRLLFKTLPPLSAPPTLTMAPRPGLAIYVLAWLLAAVGLVGAQTTGFDPISSPTQDETVAAGSTLDIVWSPSSDYSGTVSLTLLGGQSASNLATLQTLASACCLFVLRSRCARC